MITRTRVILLVVASFFVVPNWIEDFRATNIILAKVGVEVAPTVLANSSKLPAVQSPSLLSVNQNGTRTDNAVSQPSQNIQEKKPILILHVGPMKTGTTTIQMNVLGNQKVQKALRMDGVVPAWGFNYRKFYTLSHCLATGDESCARKEFGKLTATFEKALVSLDRNGTTVIHSCESYANLPDNNVTVGILRSLSNSWNVKVVAFYRRPDSWLPSLYYQMRKTNHYDSRKNTYRNFPDHSKEEEDSQPQYFAKQPTLPEFQPESRDTLALVEFYRKIFPHDAVTVLDFHSDSLASELVCNYLQAPAACRVVEQMPNGKANAGGASFLYDEDLIVLDAHRQGFFENSSIFLSRHDLAVALHKQLNDWNMTASSTMHRKNHLPKVCLNETQQNQLFQRLQDNERLVAPTPLAPDALHTYFQTNLPKMCSPDTETLLRNETWRHFFNSSCIFRRQQENCENLALI